MRLRRHGKLLRAPPCSPPRPMTTTEIFLIAMLLIFALPYLVWRLGGTDY